MKDIYDHMWKDASRQFRSGEVEIDPLIRDPNDFRRGISLIFRPHSSALEGLVAAQECLRSKVGNQYLPTSETLHVTGLSLITCVEDFRLEDIDVEHYADVVEEALLDTPAFDIRFKGLTASPSCVMAQGYVDPTLLSRARDSIHMSIDQAGLQHTIGQRYPPRTAHCTLLRFMAVPSSMNDLIKVLVKHRLTAFGDCEISEAILVFNDWYHKPSIVQELRRIPLKT